MREPRGRRNTPLETPGVLPVRLLLATRSEASSLLIETGAFPAPIHVEQMVYSAPSGKLALRNSASAISIVDADRLA